MATNPRGRMNANYKVAMITGGVALAMLGLRERADAATVALLLREFGAGG